MKALDILDALNALLLKEWPERMCYINILPNDFERPSFLIERVKQTLTDKTRHIQQIREDLTVTCLCMVDTSQNSDQRELLETQSRILELLSPGKIVVGDRAVTVTASSGKSDLGEAYVDVTVTYFEDRVEKRSSYEFMREMNMEV